MRLKHTNVSPMHWLQTLSITNMVSPTKVSDDIYLRTAPPPSSLQNRCPTSGLSRISTQAEGVRRVCNNTINGIYKTCLTPTGKIPTGKRASDVVEEVRRGLWAQENPGKVVTKVGAGGAAPDEWSTIPFDLWVQFRTHDDDHPFIVLTETKFSLRCIPVWARYSPHRTRVEKKSTCDNALTMTSPVHW